MMSSCLQSFTTTNDDKTFELKKRDTRVVVRVMCDPVCVEDIAPFTEAYTSLLLNLDEHTTPDYKVSVLMDLRSLTICLTNLKIGIISALTKFFIDNGPMSDRNVCRIAVIVGSASVATAIGHAATLVPDGVPIHVTDNMNTAKSFLKKAE
jgi:hypothetical protein